MDGLELDRPLVVAHTEARDLAHDVRRFGERFHTRPPVLEVLGVARAREPGMVNGEHDALILIGQGSHVRHLLPRCVQAEDEVALGQQGVAAAPSGIGQVFAGSEVANAAEVRVLEMTLEQRARHFALARSQWPSNGVRESHAVGLLL